MSLLHEGAGWIKLRHEPFGTLIEPADGHAVPPISSVAELLCLDQNFIRARVRRYGGEELSTSRPRPPPWVDAELEELLMDQAVNAARPMDEARLAHASRRFLLIQVECGLCNRLRVIACGLALSRATQRQLLMQWYPDDACGATFEELFESWGDELVSWPLAAPPPAGAQTLDVSNEGAWCEAARALEAAQSAGAASAGAASAGAANGGGLTSALSSALASAWQRVAPVSNEAAVITAQLRDARCLVVRTMADFYPVSGVELQKSNASRPTTSEAIAVRSQALRSLVPVASVRAQLPPYPPPADSRVLGVHVRRGDNTIAAGESPLELFVARMSEEVQQDARARFFLATDCPTTEGQLVRQFGARVAVQRGAHSRRRDTPEGVRSALVDLLSLARSHGVLGSYYSSFSTLAATWHSVPLEVLTSLGVKHNSCGM